MNYGTGTSGRSSLTRGWPVFFFDRRGTDPAITLAVYSGRAAIKPKTLSAGSGSYRAIGLSSACVAGILFEVRE